MANDFDKVKKIIDAVVAEVRNPKTLEQTGDYMVNQIKKRTLLGKGVDRTGGSPTKLRIKDKTKQVRRSVKKKGKLSNKTSPAKANLTRTGKMLDSLNRSVNRSEPSITIRVSPDQQNKVNKLAESGNKFLDLSKGEIKGMIEFLFQKIIKNIR